MDAEPKPSPPATPSDNTARAALFFLIVAIIATLPGWMPHRVYVATDALKIMPPWKDEADPSPANLNLFDQTVEFAPWMTYTRQRLRHWQIPLWNPYTQLGVPYLANGQSAVFYPLTQLHVWLPPEWSWTLSAAIRLWLAGMGTWMLARRFGVMPAGLLMSGCAFMLCGFNVVWLNHPHVNVVCLLPWCLIALLRLIDRPSAVRIAVAGLLLGAQFLGGHPGSSVHLLITCGLMFAVCLTWFSPMKALRALPAAVLALVVGFALAGAAWLPMLEYTGASGKGEEIRLASHSPSFFSMRPAFLLGMVFPYANGYAPDHITPYEISLATHLPNTSELAGGFVGIVPLLLACYALRRCRDRRMFAIAIVGLICLLIAIRFPIVDWIVSHFRQLAQIQNQRLLMTSALAMAILSGFGLDELLVRLRLGMLHPRLGRRLLIAGCAVATLGLLLSVGAMLARQPILRKGMQQVQARFSGTSASTGHEFDLPHWTRIIDRIHTSIILIGVRMLIPAAILALSGWLLMRHYRRPATSAPSAVPWIALALVDLLAFAIPYNSGSPASSYFPENPAIAYLQRQQTGTSESPAPQPLGFHVGGTYRALMPETAVPYQLYDVRTFDAVTAKRYYNLFNAIEKNSTPTWDLQRIADYNQRAYAILGMRYLMTGPAVDYQPSPPAPWRRVWPAVTPFDQAVDRIRAVFPLAGEMLLADSTAQAQAIIYENPRAMPRVWVARDARAYDSPQQVIERMQTPDFDPRNLVLVDRDIPREFKNVTKDAPSSFLYEWTSPARSIPRIRILDSSQPEKIEIDLSGAAGGWLVISDSYAPGWEAHFTGKSQRRSRDTATVERQAVVLPAYGVVKAIPIPDLGQFSSGDIKLTLEYKPRSFKQGVFLSAGGAILAALLMGLGLLNTLPGIKAVPITADMAAIAPDEQAASSPAEALIARADATTMYNDTATFDAVPKVSMTAPEPAPRTARGGDFAEAPGAALPIESGAQPTENIASDADAPVLRSAASDPVGDQPAPDAPGVDIPNMDSGASFPQGPEGDAK